MKQFLKIDISFFGTFLRGPIRLINTKITLDMALCELTLTNLVLYEITFLGQFFCLYVNVESSVLFFDIIHIRKIFVN